MNKTSIASSGIDHLLYASSDLQRGMDEIERLLGVRPANGGHHPKYGTHNALLSLGSGVYLEIIARDPALPLPKRGALVDSPPTVKSRLITWVYRVSGIEDAATAARRAAVGLGPVQFGNRTTPDGEDIRWQLTDPYAMPMEGAVPFLIDWGSTAHPSSAVPPGGELTQLTIEYPEPDRVRSALASIGAELKVVAGDSFRLSAEIATRNGRVVLN